MTPGFMVIGKIGRQESREVVFAEYDDVIEAFATQGPNHALAKGILPRAPRRGSDLFDAEDAEFLSEIVAVGRISVSQEILGTDLFLREGLLDLLPSPTGSRLARNRKVDDAASMMCEDDEHEEPLERDGRRDKEIARERMPKVVFQECPPALRGRLLRFWWHVLGDGRFGDFVSEDEKLGANSRCSPVDVVRCHATDQFNHVAADGWASAFCARLPSPIEPPARDDAMR